MSNPARDRQARLQKQPAPAPPPPPPAPEPTEEPEMATTTPTTPRGAGIRETIRRTQAYPHRVSCDLDQVDYQRLHRLSYETGRPKTELLRAALLLVSDDELRTQVTK